MHRMLFGIAVAAAWLACPLVPPARSAQTEAMVARNYDLAAIAQPVHASPFEARIAPLLGEFDGDQETVELELESGADLAARVVSFLFGRELNAPGCELRLEDGEQLRVVAPAALQRRIESALSALSAQLRQSVEVRIDLIEQALDAPVRGGVMTLADADKLVARGALWSATLRAPRGRVGMLDATSVQRFIGEYEVEVAEMAAQFGPRVETLRTGERWAVRAAPSAFGVHLALSVQAVQLVELAERQVALGGMLAGDSGATPHTAKVALHLPSTLAFAGGFNGFVPAGRALVIDCTSQLETGRSRRTWVLRCSSADAAPAGAVKLPGHPSVQLLDTSAIAAPSAALSGSSSGFGVIGDARSLEWAHGGDRRLDVSLCNPSLTELLARSTGRSSEVLSFGPFAIALCNEENATPFASVVQLAEAPAAANFTWTLRRRRAGQALTLADGATALSVGHTSAWMHGGERRLVTDASVEIASRTGTIAPRVSSALDGLLLWARPLRTSDGALECRLAIDAHVLAAPLTKSSVGAPLSVEVDHGRWDVLSAHDSLRVAKPGETARAVFIGGGGLELEVTLALAQ